jgi:hypothetical protein
VIAEAMPDRAVVVDGDRVRDASRLHGLSNVVDVSSNENSGVCTPITTNPWSLYRAAHARTYGSVRSQLMQV